MRLISLEIPNEEEALAGWLEERLAGLELGDFVVELKAILGNANAPAATLDEVLGGSMGDVLSSGLKVLSQEQLHALMRQPTLLLALQDRVLSQGGDYWSNVKIEFEHLQHVARGGATLNETLDSEDEAPQILKMRAPPVEKTHSRRQWSGAILALAAMLLVALAWWTMQQDQGWGFNRPGLMTAQASRDGYLNSLATAAEDWFSQDRSDANSLEKSLDGFIDGCETLLKAPHTPLPEADKQWLNERCGLWKGKLEKSRADLAAKNKPVAEISAEADTTIRTLQKALRERAAAA